MMIKYFISVLILFLCFSIPAPTQPVETSVTFTTAISGTGSRYITYNPKQKLVIEDFWGIPDESRQAVAITSSGFSFKAGFHSKDGKAILALSVECNFDRQQSWMKERGKNAYILSHEQHHFDITYISTLLFIKKLKKTKFTGNYSEELQGIYNNAIEEMRQLQEKYDAETNNGIIKDKQQEWNKKIDDQLSSLISE